MSESDYPEHQKLQAVRERSQAIGTFLEWLLSKGFRLAKWMKVPDEDPWADKGAEVDELVQQSIDIEKILAEFYEIDLNKLEKEKQAMLEYIRKQQKADPL
jgi:rubrerythrin